MIIDIDDFDEVGYVTGQLQEVIVRLRSRDGWFGPFSRYFDNRTFNPHTYGYESLAHRLCGNVFILTSRGESESVRLNQALPTANFIYPQLHRPQDWSEFVGIERRPTVYEQNVRRIAPFRMVVDYVTPDFRKALAPYMPDGRTFLMDEELFMLMKMRF
jgi:hypothetical protein